MTITLIIFGGFLTVVMGRWVFGAWFNHLTLYGFLWSLSLVLFHTGLIYYYPLETETWLYIAGGWLAFALGSVVVAAARFSHGRSEYVDSAVPSSRNEDAMRALGVVLWVFNVVIALEAMRHAYVISQLIGGITNFSRVGNILYQMRVKQEIPGTIPYLSSSALGACLLAGVYASRTGRFQMIWLVAPIVTIVDSALNMSRGTMIIGGVLFVTGYVTNRGKEEAVNLRPAVSRGRRYVAIGLALAIFLFGIDFVRGSRGIIESYGSATSSLVKLQGSGFITGSVVFYATGSFGVLNQYIKKDEEQGIVGGYSFAPFWRIIFKLGFPTFVEQSQPFYRTPSPSNNGTYLRELDVDFGLPGVVGGPFALGAIASVYWFKARRSQKLVDMMILGHLYVVVVMSMFLLATQWGYWLASLIFGLAGGGVVDRFVSRKRHTAAGLPNSTFGGADKAH